MDMSNIHSEAKYQAIFILGKLCSQALSLQNDGDIFPYNDETYKFCDVFGQKYFQELVDLVKACGHEVDTMDLNMAIYEDNWNELAKDLDNLHKVFYRLSID